MARPLLLGDSSKTNFQTRSNNARDNVMQEATLNNSNGTNGPHFTVEGEANPPHICMTFEQVVIDPVVRSELHAHKSEDERTRYAVAALRIGVHAKRHFARRFDRLVKRHGKLNGLLNRHLCDDSSDVAKTPASQVGKQSPLFKMLSPEKTSAALKPSPPLQ